MKWSCPLCKQTRSRAVFSSRHLARHINLSDERVRFEISSLSNYHVICAVSTCILLLQTLLFKYFWLYQYRPALHVAPNRDSHKTPTISSNQVHSNNCKV